MSGIDMSGIDMFKEMEGFRHQNVMVAPELADQAEPPDEDEDVLVQTHESINAARARRRRTTTEDVPAGTPATTTTDSRAEPTSVRAASDGLVAGPPKRKNYNFGLPTVRTRVGQESSCKKRHGALPRSKGRPLPTSGSLR